MPFKPIPAHITCRQGFPLPTCRRPRIICPLDGCFVLIYLESRAAAFATSLISSAKATSRLSTGAPYTIRDKAVGRSATMASKTRFSHQRTREQEMQISPGIPRRRRSCSGSTLGPRLRSPTIPQFRPLNPRVIVSSSKPDSTPASLLLGWKTAEIVERRRSIQDSYGAPRLPRTRGEEEMGLGLGKHIASPRPERADRHVQQCLGKWAEGPRRARI